MAAVSPTAFARSRRSRTIVPAPVTMLRSNPGEPDAMDVLRDVEGALGLLDEDSLAITLWMVVRRAWSWAAASAGERAGLRSEAAALLPLMAQARAQVPELASALDTLLVLWRDPAGAELRPVADACGTIGRWATTWGFSRTAVLFAETAAAAEPENAERAIEAGEACQRLGGMEMWRRAEQWFERAFGLARVASRSRKRLTIRALLAYGNWAREMGKYPLAEKCYVLAARRALRYRRWTQYAITQHNLLVLAGLAGSDFAAGEAHVRAALQRYPRSDERLPYFAHDYAAFLLRHGLYTASVALLQPLASVLVQPREQLLLNGSLAWAAAGAGRVNLFEEAVARVLTYASIHREFATDALRCVAEGARLLGDGLAAVEYARMALHFAQERDDADAVATIRGLLTRLAGQAGTPAMPIQPSEGTRQLVASVAERLDLPIEPSEPSPERTQEPPAASRRRSLPVCPAPDWPLWGGAETLAGLAVLGEVESAGEAESNDSFSFVLWTTLRRVLTCAATPPEDRARLFADVESSDGTQIALLRPRVPELENALALFHGLLHYPGSIRADLLADACQEVSGWATARGFLPTAVIFAEAAAAVEPADAARGIAAGEACQRLAGPEMWSRAEQWFQRAFDLARIAPRSRRLLSIRALLAYGNWARDRDDHVLAGRCYQRAVRRARRYGRWTYFAVAHHNLLVLAGMSGGDFDEAERCAEAAVNHYPPSDKRLPYLAHDYAALLVRHGRYLPAMGILRPLLRIFTQPRELLLLNGSLARAAAGAGLRDMYEEAVRTVLALVPQHVEFAADALLNVAEGAVLLGDAAVAAGHAATARTVAIQRADHNAADRALTLLARTNDNEPAPPVSEVPAQGSTVSLVRFLQARLTQHRPPPQR